MKVVYVTSSSFFDADLSYIQELRKLVDLTVLFDLPAFSLKQTAFELDNQPQIAGIYTFKTIKGLEKHTELWGQNCFIINRPIAKRLSFETLKINKALKKFLKDLQPDVIHFNNIISQYGKSLLKFPTKKIMTIHDPIPHFGENKRNLKLRASNMKFVKFFLLLNEFQKNAFIESNCLKQEQVFTTFLSSFNSYRALKQDSDLVKTQNLLFFGRITPYKGLNILIEAFNLLKIRYPELTLTIAGKGNTPVQLYDIKGINVIQRYIPVQELAELINSSSLVVCPYIEGTQSGVIMTSFAFSKPVLATKVGGFHEMIEDGVTGVLIEPNKVEELEKQLEYLLENPQKLNEISENITNVYHNSGSRSWAVSAKRTLDAYCSIN